jgi:hypothetical protein
MSKVAVRGAEILQRYEVVDLREGLKDGRKGRDPRISTSGRLLKAL